VFYFRWGYFFVWLFCFVAFVHKKKSNVKQHSTFFNCSFKNDRWKFICPLLLQEHIMFCQTRHSQNVLENCFSDQITLYAFLPLQNEKMVFYSGRASKSAAGMKKPPRQPSV